MVEVITLGRISVDLYPEQIGVPRAEVPTFAKDLGGCATNLAVAAARNGRSSAVIARMPVDVACRLGAVEALLEGAPA